MCHKILILIFFDSPAPKDLKKENPFLALSAYIKGETAGFGLRLEWCGVQG